MRISMLTLALLASLVFVGCNQNLEQAPLDYSQVTQNPDVDPIKCQTSLSRSLSSKLSSGQVKLINGKVEEVIVDHEGEGHHTEYDIATISGKRYFLNSNDPMIQNLPKNINIQLAVVEKNGKFELYKENNSMFLTQVDDKGCEGRSMQAMNVNLPTSEQVKKTIGMYFLNYENQSRFSEERIQSMAQTIQDYYTQISNGKWAVEVKAFNIIAAESKDACGTSCDAAFKSAVSAFKRENNINLRYTAYIYGWNVSGICGRGTLGGTNSWNYCTDIGTILHELGHNFGMHHASTPGVEYGDRTTIMGSSHGDQHLHAQNMVYLKLHSQETYEEVNQTKKVFLKPLEADLSETFGEIKQIVKVKGMYLAVRGDAGNYSVSRSYQGKVQVHTAGNLNGGYRSGSTLHHNIQIGDSVVKDGVKIDVIREENGIYEVDIYVDENDRAPANKPFPRRGANECIGETPLYSSLCDNDSIGLSSDLNRMAVNACTQNRKCEFRCNIGYKASIDGTQCVEDKNSCEGTTPNYAELCPGDSQGLDFNLGKELVSECTQNRKCEYKCKDGYMLDGGRCVAVKKVYISSSKIAPNGRRTNVFSLSKDTIYWRVKYAGDGALGCMSYEAADGSRGNTSKGWCDSLDDFMVMQNNDEWFWSEQYQVWALKQVLNVNKYYIPGTYEMHWYNPKTKQRTQFNFTLVP